MSTKIYNGYISNLNINQLLFKFRDIIENFENIKIEGYLKHLAEKATFEIDKKYFNNDVVNQKDVIWKIYEDDCKKINEQVKRGIRESDIDFSANCCLFPLCNIPFFSKTLILFYSESIEIRDYWKNLYFISDYFYYNNSDKPDNISENKWEQRRKDWYIFLGATGTPSKNGYVFKFTDEDLPFIHFDIVNKNIPDVDKRTLNLFHEIFVTNKIKELTVDDKFNSSIFFEAKDKWFDYKKSKEFTIEYNKMKNNLVNINF
jgi:hypothetical protein